MHRTIEAKAEGVQQTPWHPHSTTAARLLQSAGEPVSLRLKDAWILGVLVAEMTLTPRAGDIVVVRNDDEAVLRIYNRDEKGPHLDGANEGYKRLRLKEAEIISVMLKSGREHTGSNKVR